MLNNLKFEGGHPALDFANTVGHRFKQDAVDVLQTPEDLVRWQVLAGLVPQSVADKTVHESALHPRLARAALETGLALREAIYRAFLAVAHQHRPAADDIAIISGVIAGLNTYRQLQVQRDGVQWQWRFDPSRPETVLGPVAESAAELLTSDELDRVKECPAPDGYGWLFLDTSRNRSRHWCSMRDCGNVSKVRRHRKRKEKQT
jgi:predicted RNA-binding Zn ribbon-like protein